MNKNMKRLLITIKLGLLLSSTVVMIGTGKGRSKAKAAILALYVLGRKIRR